MGKREKLKHCCAHENGKEEIEQALAPTIPAKNKSSLVGNSNPGSFPNIGTRWSGNKHPQKGANLTSRQAASCESLEHFNRDTLQFIRLQHRNNIGERSTQTTLLPIRHFVFWCASGYVVHVHSQGVCVFLLYVKNCGPLRHLSNSTSINCSPTVVQHALGHTNASTISSKRARHLSYFQRCVVR